MAPAAGWQVCSDTTELLGIIKGYPGSSEVEQQSSFFVTFSTLVVAGSNPAPGANKLIIAF